MARVLLFGMGSVGIMLGWLLHRADVELVCVCRSNYDAAHANGFVVYSPILGSGSYRPTVVRSVAEAVALSPSKAFDYAIVTAKALQDAEGRTESVDAIAPAVRHGHTAIVIMQNGLGVEKPYKARFADNTVLSAVIYMPSTQTAPGVVSHSEMQRLFVGAFPASETSERTQHMLAQFAARIEVGGGHACVRNDVQADRWSKLVANAVWNPACALSLCRDRPLLAAHPLAAGVIRAAMEEVVAVAHAAGYALDGSGDNGTDVVSMQLARTAARSPLGVEPSMLADVHGGCPMEVQAIIGEVVGTAKQFGVDTPRLETMLVLLAGRESARTAA
ncbi:hypothetical protein SBRCBS47491_004542 [Sporothrix bragantina]|uniref:2-dehydropantoate 2-reductase n=1 Tax=Sporothrix bragantina TaxID=671064 RepID=A0ABP0BP57_9PEZI